METQPPPNHRENTMEGKEEEEETKQVSRLRPWEKKVLQEVKSIIAAEYRGVSPVIWGVRLLSGEEGGDVILLKFLRARDFDRKNSVEMVRRSLRWREEFGAEGIVEEELGFQDLEGRVSYMRGSDRKGHPVCYNAYGVFKEKELYERRLGDEEKVRGFLRWRVQVLERSIKLLSFKPGGVSSLVHVTDLKDMPNRELRFTSAQILALFQDNYPEMVALKIFVNVPWFFSMLYSMIRPFMTQRTTRKFVISKEGCCAAGTLVKFIKVEEIPVQYGGLWREGEEAQAEPATELTVKGGEKVNIQIEGIEVWYLLYFIPPPFLQEVRMAADWKMKQVGATIKWEIVVVGWEVEYGAEFVPVSERSYAMAVQKSTKMVATDAAIRDKFTATEPGKLVLIIDNTTSANKKKKKIAAYRYSVSIGAGGGGD